MYSFLYSMLRQSLWNGGKDIRHNLSELNRTQWLSREEIEENQLKKIQDLIAYAYEYVPFYRQRYQQEGIHPQDIKSLKDFQLVPYLTRDDVMTNLESLLSRDYQGKVFKDKTGGSTGRPMNFYMDHSTSCWSNAVEMRYRGWYGVKPGAKRAWIWGALKEFPSWKLQDRLKAYVKRYRYLNAHAMHESAMKDFAEMLVKWQPAMIRAYPSAISIFANFLIDKGIHNISPKLIETSGEKLKPSQRKLLEDVFDCPIAEHYSSWEIYDIAYQCPDGGLHVSEDRYIELVSNNMAVPAGQTGEVVVTSLTQYAMPFIRYKNEDLGVYETDCSTCGRGLPVIREIIGRHQDLLVRPDGQFVYGSILDYITHGKPEVDQFQVYQPNRKQLDVRLVCNRTVNSAWLDKLRNEIQSFFGDEMEIIVNIVDHIPLTSSGKLRTVISKVQHDFI